MYIASFALSVLSILSKNKFSALAATYFLLFIVLAFVGLRDGIGSDWASYSQLYSFSWEGKNDAMPNTGFNAIYHFFYSMGSEFNYLVLFVTFIALLPILRLSKNYKYSIIVLFLYFTVYLISLMGLMRQMIAVSLCLLAAEKLYQGRGRQYLAYVIAAIFFHTSAALFFLAYFVQKVNISIRVIFFVLIMSIAFNYLLVEQMGYYLIHHDIMAHKVKEYFFLSDYNQIPPYYSSNSLHTVIMFAQKLLFLAIFFYYFTKVSYSHRGVFYLKIYSLSFVMNMVFYLSIPVLAIRGSIYFSIVEIVLLALLCEHTRYKWLFIFLILLYGGIKYFKIILSFSTQIIPYQSVFSSL